MKRTSILTLAFSIAFAAPATAATFVGSDDGVGPGLPAPQSDAAATAFLASAIAYAPVTTINFDSSPTGDLNVYNFTGLKITTTNPGIGNGFTGISDTSIAPPVLYGFDQSAGGAGKWLGFPLGSATFNFTAPTNAFGFYISGTQSQFGASLDVTIDGVTFQAPVNVDGGSGYFGFTSNTAFSSVTVFRPGDDAWGIDNVSYNVSAVPEPATWAMMIVGFGLVGGALRRRSLQVASAA